MATDSPWAYQTVTLETPSNVHDSTWAYTYVTLADSMGNDDSRWAYQTVTILPPHEPIAVRVSGALEYVQISTGEEMGV